MRQRLLRHPLGRWIDPAVAHRRYLGDDTNSVWLDSGADANRGFSYLGAASRAVSSISLTGSVFDFLRAELAGSPIDAATPGFALGWVGWLGYELRRESLGQAVEFASRYPDAALIYLDRAIEFDHSRHEVSLLGLSEDTGFAAWCDRMTALFDGVSSTSRESSVAIGAAASGEHRARWRVTDEDYLAQIAECQRAIRDGHAYQLCLTTQVEIAGVVDPVATYHALRASSPSHHGALLRIGEVSLLSASPEQFLAIEPGGEIESRPIKGTRPRGTSEQEDTRLAEELRASDKERAENLMIVDLMRNDLGRVSRTGSVGVPQLLEVESYPHVHQLVSTVRATLAPGIHPVDAVRACFPAGSMTGAPKYSATVTLDRLERAARGIYSGAFGYFGLDGRVDLAVVIRSILIDQDGATVGAGGGITALSVPKEELAEVRLKAAALLEALGC